MRVIKASLADVKTNSYIAVTGMPQDGSQKAVALYIFPEAQRGLAEGHRPWDLQPNSTMTNATVDNQVASVDSPVLTLKYEDGEQKILMTPATEITAVARKSTADLKPGQKIFVPGAKKLDDGRVQTWIDLVLVQNRVSPVPDHCQSPQPVARRNARIASDVQVSAKSSGSQIAISRSATSRTASREMVILRLLSSSKLSMPRKYVRVKNGATH